MWRLLLVLVPLQVFAQRKDPEDWLEAQRAKFDFPALGAVVVHSNRTVLLGATGWRKQGDATAVTTNDLWHIGSCTKAMTATLAAQMVEQEEIAWDTTLAQVFTNLAFSARFGSITLEDLLRHRSGLPANAGGEGLEKLVERLVPPPDQRAALLRYVSRKSLRKRGEFLYSNLGYTLAGHMLETRADISWEDLVRARIWKPLGMASPGFGPPASPGEVDQPWGHRAAGKGGFTPVPPVFQGVRTDNPAMIGPAGTVHCSLADLAAWMNLHLGRGRLLADASFDKLHTSLPGQTYALGWGTGERDWARGPVLTHAGSNTMNYLVVWLAPKRGFGVAVATNCAGGEVAKEVDRVVWGLIQRHLLSPEP